MLSGIQFSQYSMNIQSEISVIGNGAIGKVAALALAQAGFDVVMLAPGGAAMPASASETNNLWDQRVYALNHVAHDLLMSLKVWDAMDASRIAPVDAMIIHGDDHNGAGHLAFDAYGARVGSLAWIVEDANLNHALDAALRFATNVRMVSGAARRLSVSSERAVVELENGDVLDSSLIVGADGANSWVRAQSDIGMDYRSYDQRAVVSNFECEKPHHGSASQWFLGSEGIVALLPLPGQRVSLVWSAPEMLADALLGEPAEKLAQRLNALPGLTLGQLKPLPPAAPKAFPLRLMLAHTPVSHRVTLVGDAAHVVHPLAGQGMNLGFADVDALLAALAKRDQQSDCGDVRTLGRYARARKEEVMLMRIATDGLQKLFASDLKPLRVLRNAGLGLVDRFPFLKRRLITHAMGKATSRTSE